MADIAVTLALIFVEKVISHCHHNSHRDRAKVEDVGRWLETLQAYLKDNEGQESTALFRNRVKQIRDIAYDMENVLDEYMLHMPHWIHRHKLSNQVHGLFHDMAHMGPLQDISSKIQDIETRIKKIGDLDRFHGPAYVNSLGEASSSSSPSGEHHGTPHVLKEDEIAGFDEPREKLIRQLIEEGSRDLTISVVGSGGSGKTVLLKSVYDSKEVQRQFDCHAWVHVSRSFKREGIISSILKQIVGKRVEEATPDEGEDKLKYCLQQKKYVIVFDDIWRTDHWECIQKLLPSCSNGSRIIVSTRQLDVASCCVESPRYTHHLKGLASTDAWDLFCKKAFPNSRGKCPAELEEWSRKIVSRCEGLPLAIVAVGSLLSKKPQFPNEWKKLYDSLGSQIGTNSNLSVISRILLPSYKDLPSHLKSCFLYFSIFPEDHPIEHARLVRLWVAEGFVMKARGKTPEEVAEDYLNELIGRNLVRASKLDFDGRVRSCRVLNLVLEFIVSMSEDENFVSILSEENATPTPVEKGRRLSIRDACAAIVPLNRRFSGVRSTFFFMSANFSPSDIGKFIRDFKYLRVLDLQDAPLDKFPEYIVHLSLLRYLSLRRTNIKTVPKSIEKLSYLETLDLKQTDVTELPGTIQKLVHLRHLLVYRYNVINRVTLDSVRGVKLSAGIGALTTLQKLSVAKPDKHRRIIKELGKLTQLRKLGLMGVKREDEKDLCASIQKMQNLSTLDLSLSSSECLDLNDLHPPPRHLQRLYLKGRLHSFPRWISSLNNLFRIGLKWSRLPCSPLKTLHDLPNLMQLELVDVCSEVELVFEAGKFRKLKILHIEQFVQLHTLVVQERAMPELQKLTLCDCQNLKMLPLGINYLAHLKELFLYGMHKDFIAPLQKTGEDRQMVSHIPVIHSYTLGSSQRWSFQNLS